MTKAVLVGTKMFKLPKFHNYEFKRYFSSLKDIFMSQCLKERTLLEITGEHAHVFLQGLITNDMEHLLSGAPSMFSMFLNSTGRVKYDGIIYNTGKPDYFLVECDSDAVNPLKNHLTLFKVRRKVNIISLQNSLNVWTVVNKNNFFSVSDAVDYTDILNAIRQDLPQLFVSIDPRLPSLGLRLIASNDINVTEKLEKNLGLKISEENYYKILRYKLGVGEGLSELPCEKCFPMEVNGDYLHGISFHKGCYLGQELTARTYHTGVIRKRLMPLSFEEEINVNEDSIPIFAVPQPQNESPIGKLRGVDKTVGVGLLRINAALKADELMVLNKKCKTHRPFWWPSELPKTSQKAE